MKILVQNLKKNYFMANHICKNELRVLYKKIYD